jgi:hypothetical protein
MANFKKPRKSASKRKGKVVVHQKVEVRSKSKESGKNDTLPKAPVQTLLPTNGVTFKVKMRKK